MKINDCLKKTDKITCRVKNLQGFSENIFSFRYWVFIKTILLRCSMSKCCFRRFVTIWFDTTKENKVTTQLRARFLLNSLFRKLNYYNWIFPLWLSDTIRTETCREKNIHNQPKNRIFILNSSNKADIEEGELHNSLPIRFLLPLRKQILKREEAQTIVEWKLHKIENTF